MHARMALTSVHARRCNHPLLDRPWLFQLSMFCLFEAYPELRELPPLSLCDPRPYKLTSHRACEVLSTGLSAGRASAGRASANMRLSRPGAPLVTGNRGLPVRRRGRSDS